MAPYKVLVLHADPDFENAKRKEPFYEFTGPAATSIVVGY